MGAAEVLIAETDELPEIPADVLVKMRDEWAPQLQAFLRELGPSRFAEGSPEERSSLLRLGRLLTAGIGIVGAEAWAKMLERSMVRGLDDLVLGEYDATEVGQKLALRHLQQAVTSHGEFSAVVAREFRGLTTRQARHLLDANADGLTLLQSSTDVDVLRATLDVFVAFESLGGAVDDFAHWSRRALVSTRQLTALVAGPLRGLPGDVAQIRARRSWLDWDEGDIAEEFAPWPKPFA